MQCNFCPSPHLTQWLICAFKQHKLKQFLDAIIELAKVLAMGSSFNEYIKLQAYLLVWKL